MTHRKITFSHIFLAHHPYSEMDRMLRIYLFGKELFLCTRCTGQYVAFMLYILFAIQKPSILMPTAMIWLLPIFATLDWLTQTLDKRLSTTPIRLVTGSLFGIWLGILVHALLLLDLQLLLMLGTQSAIYITLVICVLLSNKGCIDKYLKTYEEFIMEYQRQKSFK